MPAARVSPAPDDTGALVESERAMGICHSTAAQQAQKHSAACAGEHTVTVIVWDPTDMYGQERGKQTLHPKGLFYTAVSGIWQTVWLEPVPHHYIQSLRMTPDIDSGTLTLHVQANTSEPNIRLAAAVFEGEGDFRGDAPIAQAECGNGAILTIKIPDPKFVDNKCHQVFGKFSGTAVLDDGREIEVKDMVAFAEHAVNQW